MVDIESADATSAPVINVRFKLASFLLSKEGERWGQSLVPGRLHVFPDLKMNLGHLLSFATTCRGICRIIPSGRNQAASPRLNRMLNDVEKNVMKALSGLGRTRVIGAVAVVAIVVFPLIADAGLGRGSGAVKTSQEVLPVAAPPARTATAKGDSCADQHWPFFSAGCLRGSAQAVEPRLVSMNETSSGPAAAADASKAVRTVDIVRDNAPSIRSKKAPKPRIAAHRRERRTPNVNVAANLEAVHISMPGW
ncbi:MAG: hypothetical protein QOJ86_1734 [Bradyrhizobium sp.]|jgi:hypothetical protein|nr:hypothetical protein [Bradyrhizobium sp.]